MILCSKKECGNLARKGGFCNFHEEDRFDIVTKPMHYNIHPSGIECKEIIRHEPFNIGMAIKYLWRRELKGTHIQDMEKSIACIQDEIDRIKALQKV